MDIGEILNGVIILVIGGIASFLFKRPWNSWIEKRKQNRRRQAALQVTDTVAKHQYHTVDHAVQNYQTRLIQELSSLRILDMADLSQVGRQHPPKFCSEAEKQLLAQSSNQIEVYLEVGLKRTFAGAIDWPGWCRSGRDEPSALQALFEYGPRYGRVLRPARLGFQAPTEVSAFTVIERLKGNATTDFGAPNLALASDTQSIGEAELQRFQKLLKACWRTFDATARAASGKALRHGPRGGGREVKGLFSICWVATRAIWARSAGSLSKMIRPT